jgi:hypothetical protein
MKLINKFLIVAVFICIAGFLNAQTAQMPKWPLNGKEIDFINQQVNNTNASLTPPKFVSNGYYDRDNNLLFHIIDNNLWWGGGTYAGPLFEDVDPVDFDDRMYPEIVVVPTDTLFCEDGSFYAFYCVERNEDPLGKLLSCSISDVSVMYSVITPNSSGTGAYSTSNNLLTLGRTSVCKGVMIGIAATDFLPGTNTRRLYVVYFDRETLMSEIKFYTISPTAISGPYSVGSKYDWNNPFEPCEVEISSDRSKLVFTRNKYYQNTLNTNTNDVTIVHLLSTGYRNTAAGSNGYTYVDLGPANSTTDYYVGVEFSADLAYLYVTRVGDGLYRYNLNTQVITDYNTSTLPIANSQLEMGRDGYIYGMSESGQLYTIDQYGAFAQGQYNIGTTGVIDNDIFSDLGPTRDVYTIPDQIDGYDYDGLWGNADVCCYPWLENDSVRHYNGVQYEGDDIRITSGTSVVWSTVNNPWTPQGVAITDVYLKGNIIIEKNALMQVSGLTFHFKEDKGIEMTYATSTLEKGSRLYVLSNAKLTAFDECDEDALWDGINCFGNASQPQYPYSNSRQPFVFISAATIEFAEIAVEAPNGGIVRTSTANFKDNVIDVSFSGNNNYDQTVLSGSNFYTTADLYNKGYNPSYHAHLWNGSGVIFKGCDFYNDYAYQNSISYNYWGVGILATLSNIIVEETGTTRGNFSHLNYGLKLSQGTSFTLTQQNFNDCYHSAWIIANNGVSVTECDFDVSNDVVSQPPAFNYTFGLYLESCTGYYISENTFRDGLVGLIVYNSSGSDQQANNEIYKNTFQDLTGTYTSSFIGIGDNSGWPSYKKNGLQLKCNIFDNVSYSISVLGGSLYTSTSSQPITVSISDIKQYQCYNTVSENASNFWQNMPSGNLRYIYIDPSYSQTLSYEDYIYNCTNAIHHGGHMMETMSN